MLFDSHSRTRLDDGPPGIWLSRTLYRSQFDIKNDRSRADRKVKNHNFSEDYDTTSSLDYYFHC